MLGGLPPEGDLAAIHPVDPRISSRGRPARHDGGTRYEPQLHEAKGDILREVQGIDHARFTFPEIGEGQGRISSPPAAAPVVGPSPNLFLRTSLRIASGELP